MFIPILLSFATFGTTTTVAEPVVTPTLPIAAIQVAAAKAGGQAAARRRPTAGGSGGGSGSGGSADSDKVESMMDLLTPTEKRVHGFFDVVPGSGISTNHIGTFSSGSMTTIGGQGAAYALWEVKIDGSLIGTNWTERFYFSEPIPRPTTPAPLLVFHHRFGKTHLDIGVSTDYLKAAAARGWYVVAPFAASNKHMASLEAHANQEFVLDWLLNTPDYKIDTDRIYGVGFSMGGGFVMNYAARHLDPTRAMYAAVVDHSGGISHNHTYLNDPPARFIFDFWYGDGSPGSADATKMAMSSVLDYDPVAMEFLPYNDMARNMTHINQYVVRASDDLIDYLEVQADAYESHQQNVLGVNPQVDFQFQIFPFSGHDWSMLDENQALDFLSSHSLEMPTSGQVLADRNDKWFYFTTTLLDLDDFAQFDWNVDSVANELSLTERGNLEAITVDTIASGLDPQATLTVTVSQADGLGGDVYLRDYMTAPPSQVLRDGVVTGNWQVVQGILRFIETDPGTHVWEIIP